MAHRIDTKNDFVYGLVGQGSDWHGLTQQKERILREMFPTYEKVGLQTEDGSKLVPWVTFVGPNGPVGEPFNRDTYVPVLPQYAWDMMAEALAGTQYTVERIGYLADGTTWFISVKLDELATLARPGEKFQLNFTGNLVQKNIFRVTVSGVRIVCHNTLDLALAIGLLVAKVKATKNSGVRLEITKELLEKSFGMVEVYNRTLASMESTKATVDAARQVYAGEIVRAGGELSSDKLTKSGEKRESRALNTVETLVTLFQRGDGNKGETRADILNGFTQYFTRGGADDSTKDPWLAVRSSEFGGNAVRKAEFFKAVSTESGFRKLRDEGKAALAAI